MMKLDTRRLTRAASLPVALCLLTPLWAQSPMQTRPTPPRPTSVGGAHPNYTKHDITYYWNAKTGKYQNHPYGTKALKDIGPRGGKYMEKGKTYYWNVKFQKYQNHPYNR